MALYQRDFYPIRLRVHRSSPQIRRILLQAAWKRVTDNQKQIVGSQSDTPKWKSNNLEIILWKINSNESSFRRRNDNTWLNAVISEGNRKSEEEKKWVVICRQTLWLGKITSSRLCLRTWDDAHGRSMCQPQMTTFDQTPVFLFSSASRCFVYSFFCSYVSPYAVHK